eukprot:2809161-Prymnesium_polylepis.1
MDFSSGKPETADSLSAAWRPSSALIQKVVEADERNPFDSTDGVQAFIDEALQGYQPPTVQRQSEGGLEGLEALAHPAVEDVDNESVYDEAWEAQSVTTLGTVGFEGFQDLEGFALPAPRGKKCPRPANAAEYAEWKARAKATREAVKKARLQKLEELLKASD